MPRLIDADALYKSFGATGNCNGCPLDAYKCQYYNEHTMMEFCERIDDAPTVDAVEVVRCKDCKHYGVTIAGEFMQMCRKLEYTHHEEDDFCSWGEKKDE